MRRELVQTMATVDIDHIGAIEMDLLVGIDGYQHWADARLQSKRRKK